MGRLSCLLGAASWLLTLPMVAGCDASPTAKEVALRATVEALRDEVIQLRATPVPLVAPAPTAVPSSSPAASPRPAANGGASISSGPDSKFLNWQTVNQSTRVGDLGLDVAAILRGLGNYGGPYGSRFSVPPGTKAVLVDLTLTYAPRPGMSPVETHVDYLMITSSSGLEYHGLSLPVDNVLPERVFLSPGQAYRGIVGFLVPDEMKSGQLSFTNFGGGNKPPDRLAVNLMEIP